MESQDSGFKAETRGALGDVWSSVVISSMVTECRAKLFSSCVGRADQPHEPRGSAPSFS